MGDTNAHPSDERRVRTHDCKVDFAPSTFSKVVEETLNDFCDLGGHFYTHRHEQADGQVSLSRIDRCLMLADTAAIVDRRPLARAVGCVVVPTQVTEVVEGLFHHLGESRWSKIHL